MSVRKLVLSHRLRQWRSKGYSHGLVAELVTELVVDGSSVADGSVENLISI